MTDRDHSDDIDRGIFSVEHVIDREGGRKLLGDLTAEDHLAVAGLYRLAGALSGYRSTMDPVHVAIARRIDEQGKTTTREVLTEAEYEALVEQILGSCS